MTEARARLVYLLAASHSGTTLTALLLASHPAIATVGELKQTSLGDVGRYLCSCGVPIRRCLFWRAVCESLLARGWSFEPGDGSMDLAAGTTPYVRRLLKPLHRGRVPELLRDAALGWSPGWQSHLEQWQRSNAWLVEAVRELTGCHCLVDSSKIGICLKYLLRNPALDVRVLRVVRDGRAVMLTYMDPARYADARDERLRGGGCGGERVSERLSSRQAAVEWRRSNEEAACIVGLLPRDAWRQVRYEDICLDPQTTLRPVLRWLGVDADVALRLDRSRNHVVGNGMRLDAADTIGLDDRWRTTLTHRQLAEFESLAGDLNRRLGYS